MDVRLQLTKRPTNFPFRRSGTGDQHSTELEQIKVSPLMRRRCVGRVVKEKGTQSQTGYVGLADLSISFLNFLNNLTYKKVKPNKKLL